MNKPTLAYYIRLSSADEDVGDTKDESNSITNQRMLITRYLQEHSEFSSYHILEFVDDGFSGSNENRPDFQKMLQLAQEGRIQCIVVKDLSRFARNYITAGRYTEQIFPELGIRFIAINDHYDSSLKSAQDETLSIVLKSIMNAYYCKDISKKVKTSVEQRMKAGTYLPSPPFGYKKSEEDGHYVIDEKSGAIVRYIFDLALEGKSRTQIANILNQKGYPSRSAYSKRKYNMLEGGNSHLWTTTSVGSVLGNVAYIGTLVHRKKTAISPGSKRFIRTDSSEQILHEGAFPPIVTPDEFASVSIKYPEKAERKTASTEKAVLQGLVRCGYCKHSMKKTGSRKSFVCVNAHIIGSGCSSKKYDMAALEKIVYDSLLPILDSFTEKHRANELHRNEHLSAIQKEIRLINKRKQGITAQRFDAYEAYLDGKLSVDDYNGSVVKTKI